MSLAHMGLITSPWSWYKVVLLYWPCCCPSLFCDPPWQHVGRTLRSLLATVKPKTTGVVYCISCMDHDRLYIGETCRTLNIWLKEHQWCCRNLDLQKFAIAQHAVEEDHRIDWDNSMVINKEFKWHWRRLKEAMYIKKYNNFNLFKFCQLFCIDLMKIQLSGSNKFSTNCCEKVQ